MLKTHIVQPLYHSNQRSEFRISSKGKVLMPNLRLCNFGVVLPAGTALFSLGAGCLALIKNIVLYSGNIILDQITDADQWLGVMNMATSCQEAYDIKQKLLCSNLNLKATEVNDYEYLEFQDLSNKLIGRVNLQEVFPFLRSNVVVGKGSVEPLDSLADFDDLRLVIEYHTAATHIFAASDLANTRPANWTVNQPELVFEEMVDESMAAEMIKSAPSRFIVSAVERERLDITGVGSTRLRGFDGKQVVNLVLQTIPGGNPEPQLCYSYSTITPDEKLQLVVNGRKLLPFQGADSAARKSALFADTVGQFLAFTGSNDKNFGSRAVGAPAVYTQRPAGVLGDMSFMGVSIEDTISQMEVEYYTSNFAAVQIWAWGVVLKYVSKDKSTGAIQTGYVVA